ncbi:MAG: radical SAM protein [Candidatus Eremiobacterota bacterium]
MKKINKILMIEPKSPDVHIFSLTPVPRLGTIILGTILKERGFDVAVIAEEIHPVKDEYFENVQLVGISSTTSTAVRAYALADRLREKGITVVMGGPHVTFMPEEAINHADYVVLGEGENIFPELVEALDRGETLKSQPGLVVRGEEVHHIHAQKVKNLDDIPIPDFSIVMGMNDCTVRGTRVIPIQASRGCPFDCCFCSVTDMFGRKFRHKSIERVLQEVERFNSKKYNIFFYDDNIAADKKWLKQLLREFVKREMKFSWCAQVRIDAAKDEELLDLMKATHCQTVFIGIESLNPDTLKAMNKNQTAEEIKQGVAAFTAKKIPVHGMFVFGLDTDTRETLEGTISFAKYSGITTVQFLILTPLPGTRTYKELKSQGRIFTDDWSLYDGHHVTFQPENLTPVKLQEMQVWGHNKFYSLWRLIKKFMKGKFIDAAIYAYAKNINRLWKKSNKFFMNYLNFMSISEELTRRIKAFFDINEDTRVFSRVELAYQFKKLTFSQEEIKTIINNAKITIKDWYEITEDTIDKVKHQICADKLKVLANKSLPEVELKQELKKMDFKQEEINVILNQTDRKVKAWFEINEEVMENLKNKININRLKKFSNQVFCTFIGSTERSSQSGKS